MMKRIAIALMGWFIAAPAWAGLFGASDKDLEGLHRTAVVSAMGNTYHMVEAGFTIFQNKIYNYDVSHWRLDDYARDELLRMMASGGRLKVEPLDLAELPPTSLRDTPADMQVSRDGRQRLMVQARKQGFDSLLLIEPSDWSTTFPVMQAGYGFYRHSVMKVGQAAAYASIAVELYRLDTGKIVEQRSHQPTIAGHSTLEPKPAFDAYLPEDQGTMMREVKAKITESLHGSLVGMKLLQP